MAKDVKVLMQDGNGCGTASLAMILNAIHDNRPNPRVFTQEELDAEIRPMGIFSAPVRAADIARRFGVASRLCNDGDFNLLNTMVRRGNVCQLIVDAPQASAGGNAMVALHYIVVDWVWEGSRSDFEPAMDDAPFFAYGPGEQGRWVRIKDSAGFGAAYIMRYDHLEKQYWSNLTFGPAKTGFNNFVIVYGDTDADVAFPKGYSTFDASATLLFATNASEFLTAVIHTVKFHPTGVPRTIKNGAEAALGIVAFLVKTPGAVIGKVGDEGMELGKRMLRSDASMVEKAGGAIVAGVSTPIWLAAKPVEWLGDGFGYLFSVFD